MNDGNLTLSMGRWASSSRWISIAMLVFFHAALWVEIDNIWARPLLLAHIGLFLLWQPLWRREEKLSWSNSVFVLAISFGALVWLNWWVLAFWVSGLFALVGGRVLTFYSRWQRAYYLLMMAYLLAVLLLFIAPHLFQLPALDQFTHDLIEFVLPVVLLVMTILPVERDSSDNVQPLDFIYVVLLFTLLTLLVMGSLAFMTLGRISYLESLLRTLFMLGATLLALGILWSPRMGFAGLQASFSRYVLSIGTPLEEWLKQIAEAAQQEQYPAPFLQRATSHLLQMPSICGVSWLSNEGHGTLGESSQYRIELAESDLVLTLFTRQNISPSILLHMKLLVQVLGYYYRSKCHELRLREMTRQQAIYETGARLTHDLKNMLQSLFALTSVAQHDATKAQPILKNQLPVLTQRIEALLVKLNAPGETSEEIQMPLTQWWESLRQRHQHRDIEWVFASPLSHGGLADVTESTPPQLQLAGDIQLIPAPLFDCVADNLIENALNKRQREPGIHISVQLNPNPVSLQITDSGSAVPQHIAHSLLRTMVPSEDGLGVGMYQAARWAKQMGYHLKLSENKAGSVMFEMVRE